MGIAERKIRQKEEVRCAILDAAWNLALTEGWQALSIRKIAEAIEYSVPVIYDHFQNKDDILMEFTRRGFKKMDTDLTTAKAVSDDPADQLRNMADAYWQFAFANKQYYQLMFGLGMPSCEMVHSIKELYAFTSTIQESIKSLIEKSNSETDPWLKYHTYWSLLHGLVSINMLSANQQSDLSQKVLHDFIDSFINGIRK